MRATILVALAAAVAVCVVLGGRGVDAAIAGNPDSWELPPAAPDYFYQTQGLLGSGATSTLVTIRDPLSTDTAYNTSLYAFSVSGGLVPLNYIALSDGHCSSTMVADVLVCDFQHSGPVAPTIFYQLQVTAGSGGANRVRIASQLTAPLLGKMATVAPVYVQATGRIVLAQWAPLPNGPSDFTLWELDRSNKTGEGLELISIGSLPALMGQWVGGMAVSAEGDRLVILAEYGTLTYSFPDLQLLSNDTNRATAQYSYLLNSGTNAGALNANLALAIGCPNQKNQYTTVDLTTLKPTGGGTLTDPATSFYSSGLYFASSAAATPFTQGYGPCVYVAGYNNAQPHSVGNYTVLSQIRVPTTGSGATGIAQMEAQVTLGGTPMGTLVANDKYMFVVINEIMYRYIATC